MCGRPSRTLFTRLHNTPDVASFTARLLRRHWWHYRIAHVGYLPTEKVIGLSKIPRIVDMYARRLQIQERLSQQIANTLDEILSAKGTIVVIEGEHECAALRGVRKKNMRMKTIATTGIYQEDPEMKKEFLSMIG